ncbi:hypothetical protein [Mycobacterium paraterrae]|uniref:Uncharacterized protein n=1 Tax=Mycobacterium paraterrae TaxID=577492 RepID=A0ABY3VFC9_9MYCO|nr:hypothetical protein [Mycobacterium paraterrae]UMB68124.1 hypothetical protein MKK62_16885 [Mycobacterium paraterrae]
MGKFHRIARAGVVATGLGLGAAVASVPGIATADYLNGSDIAAYLPDFGAVAAASAAAVTPPTVPDDFSNFAISFSGIPLYQSGSALAQSSFGNIAIAHGASTYALAYGGLFNTANVDGDGSGAFVGSAGSLGFPLFNTASVTGDHSVAEAAYGFGSGSYNTATVVGNQSTAYAGTPNGGLTTGSFNTATAEGYQAHAAAGLDGSSGNVADANGDLVTDVSPNGLSGAADPASAAASADLLDSAAAAASVTPATLPDDYSNFAVSISGLDVISIGHASAESSFGNIAIAHGLYSDANAMSGFFNYATADGDHSTAVVGDTGSFNFASATGLWSSAAAAWGSGNTAVANGDYAVAQAGAGDGTAIYDSNLNTATAEGSHAIALAGWDGSSNHVANAVGDNVHVYDPTGTPMGWPAESWTTDLLTSLDGHSAATEGGNWFTDLLSSFDGSAAAESSNWLTELVASFDGGSVAADGANFWSELTTLF